MPLSSALGGGGAHFDGRRLAVVGRGVTELNRLPEQYASIKARADGATQPAPAGSVRAARSASSATTRLLPSSRPPAPSPAAPIALGLFPQALYVSRNALRSLAGAAQFAALRALSAADNLLGDARELRALQAAGLRLELAVLSGNPLAARPNYRAHAIDALGPTLRVLDGRPVGAAERGGFGWSELVRLLQGRAAVDDFRNVPGSKTVGKSYQQ